jgi:hypothetical protein
MITAGEVARAIQGSWRLARFDSSGLDFFGKTIEDFWRSFWAAAIVAPAHLIMLAVDQHVYGVAGGAFRYYAFHVVAYVIAWTAYPFAMFYLTRLMDRSEHFIEYIVAYNWSHLLQMAIIFPFAMLNVPDAAPAGGATEGVPVSAWLAVLAIAEIYVLFYVGYIAKSALRITGMMAAGIVALDYALSLVIVGITDAFTG